MLKYLREIVTRMITKRCLMTTVKITNLKEPYLICKDALCTLLNHRSKNVEVITHQENLVHANCYARHIGKIKPAKVPKELTAYQVSKNVLQYDQLQKKEIPPLS